MNENENKELMVVEEEVIDDPEITEEEHSGMSTGVALLIGGGLAIGAIALGKTLKKVWDKRKLKKNVSVITEEANSSDEHSETQESSDTDDENDQ